VAGLPRAHARSARASRLDLPGTVSHINDYFDQQGWTDGLPIIPPTEDLVSAMLEVSPAPADRCTSLHLPAPLAHAGTRRSSARSTAALVMGTLWPFLASGWA